MEGKVKLIIILMSDSRHRVEMLRFRTLKAANEAKDFLSLVLSYARFHIVRD